jgi:hypothetical protein
MSPSQEVLNSIESRLRELEQEIAALESARSELQGKDGPPRRKRGNGRPRKPRASTKAAPATPELTDEEWVARRAAELAAQSRAAAA